MILLAYLVLGLVAGILAGLFGVGGGVVLVPAFILLFEWQNFSPDVLTYMAIGSSLACIVFSASSSVWAHHQKQAVLWTVFWRLVPGIAVGSFLGVHTAVSIPAHILNIVIAIFMIFIGIKMLRGIDLAQGKGRQGLPGSLGLFSVGGVIGWVSAIFGIGGGTLTVPFLQHCKVIMQKAVATSSACGLPIAIVGAITNMLMSHEALPEYALGFVFLPAVAMTVLASVPGAKLGALLAHRLDAQKLKKYFAWFMLILGIILSIKFLLGSVDV